MALIIGVNLCHKHVPYLRSQKESVTLKFVCKLSLEIDFVYEKSIDSPSKYVYEQSMENLFWLISWKTSISSGSFLMSGVMETVFFVLKLMIQPHCKKKNRALYEGFPRSIFIPHYVIFQFLSYVQFTWEVVASVQLMVISISYLLEKNRMSYFMLW